MPPWLDTVGSGRTYPLLHWCLLTEILSAEVPRVLKDSSKNPQIVPRADSERVGECVYEFESFRLDSRERLLLRDGKAIPLTSKVFDTLLLLVKNSGHLVLKDDLMTAVWPDSFVEEANLSQNVSVLRKALGDITQNPRYIITVPGQGYRFAAEVRQTSAGSHKAADLLIIPGTGSRVEQEEKEDRVESEQARKSIVAGILLILVVIAVVIAAA